MTGFQNAILASIPSVFFVAFILTLGVAAAASAQEMSAQQRDFAAPYRQCTERIRALDSEPARQSAREACQAQLQQLIGSKLDNWAGRVTSVRIEPDTVELEVASFGGEKVVVLTRIMPSGPTPATAAR